MVERPLSKPEVRGAIPRISEVKDIEQLINFLQKTTEYWNLIQEIPSQKIYNLLYPTQTKASSTVLNYGDVAQMVACERYGDRCPASPKLEPLIKW